MKASTAGVKSTAPLKSHEPWWRRPHRTASRTDSARFSFGRDPFDIEQLWELMYRKTIYYGRQAVVLHAMSGVDMALWDILGKATGKPVHKLLGGSYRKQARAYASVLMPETPAEAERSARGYAAQGFTAMKFGWGPLGRDEGLDVELIAAARSGAGDQADLMIDIGQRYTVKRAIRTSRRLGKFRLHWMEEPLPPDDFDGYRRLTAAVPIDIAAGEAESGRLAFKRLIEKCHVDVIQPDISRAGGSPSRARLPRWLVTQTSGWCRTLSRPASCLRLACISSRRCPTLNCWSSTWPSRPCVRNCSLSRSAPLMGTSACRASPASASRSIRT
jgi:L-alanine-DL-glutamate epimerase-like enolase superfamily enzyme